RVRVVGDQLDALGAYIQADVQAHARTPCADGQPRGRGLERIAGAVVMERSSARKRRQGPASKGLLQRNKGFGHDLARSGAKPRPGIKLAVSFALSTTIRPRAHAAGAYGTEGMTAGAAQSTAPDHGRRRTGPCEALAPPRGPRHARPLRPAGRLQPVDERLPARGGPAPPGRRAGRASRRVLR